MQQALQLSLERIRQRIFQMPKDWRGALLS